MQHSSRDHIYAHSRVSSNGVLATVHFVHNKSCKLKTAELLAFPCLTGCTERSVTLFQSHLNVKLSDSLHMYVTKKYR